MNKKETDILKKAYKKEADGKIKERILMVRYSYEGKTSRNIGEMLQCDHALVLFWKKRYVLEGIEGLKSRQKSGKPMLLSRRQEETIKNKVAEENMNNPWTTKRVCELIKKETGKKYSPRHVRRMLHKWNFSLLVPRPTFWQKASGEEINNFWKKNTLSQEEIS